MIILASGSPRRREILNMLGFDFKVAAAECDETTTLKRPAEVVKLLSKRKAQCVKANKKYNDKDIIIGADTVVYCDGKILGKPKDKDDAFNMLRFLSGKTHYVYTGICVIKGNRIINEYDKCAVRFTKMIDKDILEYVSTNEPMDKAGAYGIQGKGSAYIDKINGSFFTVMGLPCHLIAKILKEFL